MVQVQVQVQAQVQVQVQTWVVQGRPRRKQRNTMPPVTATWEEQEQGAGCRVQGVGCRE